MPQPSMYVTAPPSPGGPAPFPWHATPGSLMRVSDEGYGPAYAGYGQIREQLPAISATGFLIGIPLAWAGYTAFTAAVRRHRPPEWALWVLGALGMAAGASALGVGTGALIFPWLPKRS